MQGGKVILLIFLMSVLKIKLWVVSEKDSDEMDATRGYNIHLGGHNNMINIELNRVIS